MPHVQSASPVRPEDISETRVFVGDAIIAIRVLNEGSSEASVGCSEFPGPARRS